jgi:(S)-sulfolactate dehydrogenase
VRIVISEFMDEQAVSLLARHFDVRYDPSLVEREVELENALASANALIVRNRTKVTAALISGASSLAVVGRLGVGLDNIDVDACAARDIRVIPATGANAQAVAEYVIAAALILLRGAYGSTQAVANGNWLRAQLSEGRELAGRTLALIGFGGIGRLTGRLARALDLRVVAYDANIASDATVWRQESTTPVAIERALAEADIVSLHVPLDASTRNLIDARQLSMMKRDAILINTSRGGIIDETAVAAALRANQLGGAALDVFEHEPLAASSPLADCPHLLLTPHIAGITRESNVRVSMMIAEKVAAALAGRA